MQPAQRLYSEGLSLISGGDYANATERIREALQMGIDATRAPVLLAALEALMECDRLLNTALANKTETTETQNG
jgi:hypothetical protein